MLDTLVLEHLAKDTSIATSNDEDLADSVMDFETNKNYFQRLNGTMDASDKLDSFKTKHKPLMTSKAEV